jgi:hypothetical protein
MSFHILIVPRTHTLPLEFATKRKNAMETIERLELEAQVVLDVIEKPEVAQALRQDKMQNLQYLKDNYGVCGLSSSKTSIYSQTGDRP